MISDNLLREPDNSKFQQFKPTNNAIKKRLVDVKGALEFAVAVSTPLTHEICIRLPLTAKPSRSQLGFHLHVRAAGGV